MRTSIRARTGLILLMSLAASASLVTPVIVLAETREERAERSQLSVLLGGEADEGFSQAIEPRNFEFPSDHGPHPGYRNEWWYFTCNLDSTGGRRFGFELTIFRFALTPAPVESSSAWRTNQIYIAHFAVTDVESGRFLVAERISRGALGLAGASGQPFRVWIDDWEIAARAGHGDSGQTGGAENWRLRASDEEFALDMSLVALKAPVLNGTGGLSQKSAERGNASYYYSISRWRSDGRLRIGKENFAVSGLSWLDREWSSSALAADQQGWDWFALQLSDGSELMFYKLRKLDGTQDAHSAGTWIAANGDSRHLGRAEVSVSVVETWQSPQGGRYPSVWDIDVPGEELSLRITPVMDDQELFTTVRYWEGAVDVVGERDGIEIDGRGYVELTGYAD